MDQLDEALARSRHADLATATWRRPRPTTTAGTRWSRVARRRDAAL